VCVGNGVGVKGQAPTRNKVLFYLRRRVGALGPFLPLQKEKKRTPSSSQ
jgi:hypothetical protein